MSFKQSCRNRRACFVFSSTASSQYAWHKENEMHDPPSLQPPRQHFLCEENTLFSALYCWSHTVHGKFRIRQFSLRVLARKPGVGKAGNVAASTALCRLCQMAGTACNREQLCSCRGMLSASWSYTGFEFNHFQTFFSFAPPRRYSAWRRFSV